MIITNDSHESSSCGCSHNFKVRTALESMHHGDPHTEYDAVMNQKETGHNLCQRTNTEFADKTAVQQQTCSDCLPQYREKNTKY